MKLQDKVALITGGAQGLGKSIALAMAREGANIVICDINPDTIPAAVAEIEALGRACLGVRCDASSSDSVREMHAQLVARFGTLQGARSHQHARPGGGQRCGLSRVIRPGVPEIQNASAIPSK